MTSDLPPPSERGELAGLVERLEDLAMTLRTSTASAWDHGKANGIMEAVEQLEPSLLSAEAQITALKAEREDLERCRSADVETMATLANRAVAAESKNARLSALLDQAREVVTDLVRFAGEVVGCQDAPNRGDWGVECPLCMGELVELQDRDLIDAASAFLTRPSKAKPQPNLVAVQVGADVVVFHDPPEGAQT